MQCYLFAFRDQAGRLSWVESSLEIDEETARLRVVGERLGEARCKSMMKEGVIEETEDLLRRGFSADCPALTGLGYPRVVAYLKGTLSKDDCLQLLIQDTRQYAKRQMTWFRREADVHWLDGFGDQADIRQAALALLEPAKNSPC